MKIIYGCFLIILGGLLLAVSMICPDLIFENTFLVDFINHELLNAQIVIVTVTLVSITQAHVEISRLERRIGERIFDDARGQINLTAGALISFLLVIIVTLIFVGGLDKSSPRTLAALMSVSLFFLIFSIISMTDIIRVMLLVAGGDADDDTDDDKSETGT